jgi:tetrahydromethanopterin:alpha-L-glutamate ligase
MARLVIFTEQADWHTRRLKRACRKRGVEAHVLSLKDGVFALGQGGLGVVLPGFEDRLPDAVIVRVVASGSFEQVTVRLGLLHALGHLGVPVINSARAIERCVDKSMTSFLIDQAGLPTPPTWVVESRAAAQAIIERASGDTIAKPLFGAQGRHLRRVEPGGELPDLPAYNGIYYLQNMVEQHGRYGDYRVMVMGDRAIAAMRRESQHWITNVAKGAECAWFELAGELGGRLAELAVAATRAVGASYAGVDLIESVDGELSILEVNSMPAWRGLQSVAPFDIGEALVDHALAQLTLEVA